MHEAKPILIFFGAVLAAVSLGSRELASEYIQNLPRQYFSAVTIEIKPSAFNRETGIPVSATSSARIDPGFLAAELQMITKLEILDPVVERLDLVKKLSPPGMTMPRQWVTEVLKRSIVVQEKRNTNLIEIGTYHTDSQLAADIANTIAITYRDKRIEDMRKEMDLMLAGMKDESIVRRTREDIARFDAGTSTLPVKIWERAVSAQNPARPDAVRMLRWSKIFCGTLGVIGVLLILIGVFVPSRMFWRAEDQK